MAQSTRMSTKVLLQEFSRLGHASEAEKKELSKRKKRHLEGKSKGRPWSEVKASLLQADGR